MSRKLSEQLRKAILKSGMSRYRICKVICMEQAQMSRFVSGSAGMSVEMMDAIGKLLDLELVKRQKKGGRK